MINKIKSLLDIKKEIDEINKKLEFNKTGVDDLTKGFSSLRFEFDKAKEFQDNMLQVMNENLNSVKNIKEQLENEIYEFKLLKTDLQRKVLAKFEEELEKDLKTRSDNLSKEAEQYDDLKNRVVLTSKRIELLTQEIEKFIEISQKIHAKDFEMEKFAKQLLETDKEKLELMKKIDTLERLCAQFKRRV